MEAESSTFESPPSPKRTKLAEAATYGTKFKLEWMVEFSFIAEGHQNPVYSFYCQVDVSCRHQGIADVRRHERSKSHSDNVSAAEGSSRLTNMGFVPVGSAIDKQVCADACAFALFLI